MGCLSSVVLRALWLKSPEVSVTEPNFALRSAATTLRIDQIGIAETTINNGDFCNSLNC